MQERRTSELMRFLCSLRDPCDPCPEPASGPIKAARKARAPSARPASCLRRLSSAHPASARKREAFI